MAFPVAVPSACSQCAMRDARRNNRRNGRRVTTESGRSATRKAQGRYESGSITLWRTAGLAPLTTTRRQLPSARCKTSVAQNVAAGPPVVTGRGSGLVVEPIGLPMRPPPSTTGRTGTVEHEYDHFDIRRRFPEQQGDMLSPRCEAR